MESIAGKSGFLRIIRILALIGVAIVASSGCSQPEPTQFQLLYRPSPFHYVERYALSYERDSTFKYFVITRHEPPRYKFDEGLVIPRRPWLTEELVEEFYEDLLGYSARRSDAITELYGARDAFRSGDYVTAIRKALPAAEIGLQSACGTIGFSYKRLGDHVHASTWFGLAGESYLALHQLELDKLSSEELMRAHELMAYLEHGYCRGMFHVPNRWQFSTR